MATQARDVLRIWRAGLGDTQDPMERGFAAELDANLAQSDAYLRYEHLAEINHPAWFSDVAAQAAGCGLAYLCDAVPSSHQPFADPTVEDWIRARTQDFVEVDALRDMFSHRLFRRDLYVHRERYIDRDPSWRRLDGLVVASRFQEDLERSTDTERVFSHRTGGTLRTEEPGLIQVLRLLQEFWPNGVRFSDLADAYGAATARERAALGTVLMDAVGHGAIELWTDLPQMLREEALSGVAHPRAPSYSRLQASRGDSAVNLRHERIMLNNGERSLLRLLDGTRGEEALVTLFQADAEAGRFHLEIDGVATTDPDVVRQAYRTVLGRLCKAGFLYGTT
jgi:methyltransferase-like protein